MGEGTVREVPVVQWCYSLHSTKAGGEGGLLILLEVRLVMLARQGHFTVVWSH